MTTDPAGSPLPPFPVPAFDEPGARRIDLSERPVAENLSEIMASSPRLPQTAPTTPAVTDRTEPRYNTLTTLGVLWVTLSLLQAARSVWHVAGQGLESVLREGGEPLRWLVAQPLVATANLAVGLGLMACRRWARASALASVWAATLFALAGTAASLPKFLQEGHATTDTVAGGTLALWVALEVGLVLCFAWVLHALLSDRDVRATCESEQPGASWTDRLNRAELVAVVATLLLVVTLVPLSAHAPFPAWGSFVVAHARWLWFGLLGLLAVSAAVTAAGWRGGWLLVFVAWGAWLSAVSMSTLQGAADAAAAFWRPLELSAEGGLVFSFVLFTFMAFLLAAAGRPRPTAKK